MYKNIASLLAAAKERGVALHEIVLESEMNLTGKNAADIRASLLQRWQVMRQSAHRALDAPQEMFGGLIRGQSRMQNQNGGRVCGASINRVMSMALSGCEVNAAMGLICAAPTAGSCGILPAVLCEVADVLHADEETVLNALLLAGGIGAVVTKNATVSGAEGGCQAECGVAAAMAAAATVYLYGGSAEMCAEAVSIALINCMGLVCDPVAGLVQLPCSFRNASGAVNALISADMALAGQTARIPADEVVDAMYRVGRQMPAALRETALGGIAATKTAQSITRELFPEKE